MMEREKSNIKFEELIHENSLSEKEISELKDVYQSMDELDVPEPSASMYSDFYHRLEEYKLKRSGRLRLNINWPDLSEVFGFRPLVLRPAFGVILFLIGIITGLLLNNRQNNTSLVAELQNSQKTLMLTLLEQPSATERLKAVNLTSELNSPDKMITHALFTTLNNDDNVNVRLAALEALFNYSELPEVREGLVESISHQKSALVLVTLSKAMVILQEKDSVEKLKKLLNEGQFDDKVKETINSDIQKII